MVQWPELDSVKENTSAPTPCRKSALRAALL